MRKFLRSVVEFFIGPINPPTAGPPPIHRVGWVGPSQIPTPSGTNTVLQWSGSAFSWAAGTGASVTGTGVWHSTAGVLDAAADIGTADQLFGTNHGATDASFFTLTGDGAIVSGALTVSKMSGTTPTIAPGGTTALTVAGGANVTFALPAGSAYGSWIFDATAQTSNPYFYFSTNGDYYINSAGNLRLRSTAGTEFIRLNASANALVNFTNSVTNPSFAHTALASTSAASGTAGVNFTCNAQAGQAATGATHNGGAGGDWVAVPGLGGTSGSATAGVGGSFRVLGGLKFPPITITASTYTVDTNSTQADGAIILSSGANTISATLPTPTSGRTLILNAPSAATHNVTILPHAAETINGAASYVMTKNGDGLVLFSDGTNWFIAAAYSTTIVP
jgi:hypothetical protein